MVTILIISIIFLIFYYIFKNKSNNNLDNDDISIKEKTYNDTQNNEIQKILNKKDAEKKMRESNYEKEYRTPPENIVLVEKIKEFTPNGSEFIALDIETTGLDVEYDEIIEIAAIKYSNNEIVEVFNTLIRPKKKIPYEATKINGIFNHMIEDAPIISHVLPELISFLDENIIVGHNISFDLSFIEKAYYKKYKRGISFNSVDTVKLSRELFSNLKNHKLETVIKHLKLDVNNRHRAYDDAKACAEIYILYLNEIFNCALEKINDSYECNKLGMRMEKFDELESIKFYEKAISMDFEGNHPYDRLAIIYRRHKKYNDEVRVLEKAIEVFEALQISTKRPDVNKKLNRFKERLIKAKALSEK